MDRRSRRGFGKEIRDLLNSGKSNKDIAEALGVSPSSVTHHAKKMGVATLRGRQDWPEIIAAYDAGASFEDCCARFGLTLGAMWKAAKRGLFTARPQRRSPKNAAEHAESLMGKDHGRAHLRRKILQEDLLPYQCAVCGISEWRGAPLTLRLDHIDGNRFNNSLDNFRFVCPNCDSQSETFGHRNRNRYRESGEKVDTLVLGTSASA